MKNLFSSDLVRQSMTTPDRTIEEGAIVENGPQKQPHDADPAKPTYNLPVKHEVEEGALVEDHPWWHGSAIGIPSITNATIVFNPFIQIIPSDQQGRR
jgi:hypothetical protein